MHEIRTRPASAGDSTQLVELVVGMTAEISGSEVASRLTPQLHAEVAAATSGDPDDFMLVAEHGGRLLGCGRVRVLGYHPMLRFGPDPRHAYVELMYVVPEARASGLASRILDELETWVLHRGLAHVTLHHSPRARTFYERHGYSPLAEMHKLLGPPASRPD